MPPCPRTPSPAPAAASTRISARRTPRLQAARVAKARGLSPEKVRELIRQNTDPADLGILGEPGVNVLRLNLALDEISDR